MAVTKISLSSLRRYEGLGPNENPYEYIGASVIERIKEVFEFSGIEFLNSEDSLGVLLRRASNPDPNS